MKMTSRSYQEESLSSVGLRMIFAIVSFCCWLVCIFSIFYNEMCCFYKEKIKFKLETEKKKEIMLFAAMDGFRDYHRK